MDVRINKYLSGAGFCSRREADRLVEAGRVQIDQETAVMGARVPEGAVVSVDGKAIKEETEEVLIAFHKPVGIVCTTTDKQGSNNIVDFIHYGKRIYPIGRLDKESEGLILLTNNGEIMNRMLKAQYGHEKEYLVDVDRAITPEFISAMGSGIYIRELDKTTAPCKVVQEGKRTFRIILIQGMNRQVRRMCECLGYGVTRLRRIRVMNIELGSLEPGAYRNLTHHEYRELMNELQL